MIKSPLKWAGGKSELLDRILPHLSGATRVIEPFFGSGVVGVNASVEAKVTASDACSRLMEFHGNVKTRVDEVIAEATSLFNGGNTQERYLAARAEFNRYSALKTPRDAALFLYLNRHCFNGLYRENKKGEFNVPFGKYTNVELDTERLLAWSRALQGVELLQKEFGLLPRDFGALMAAAGPGDVVYCDPPYVPLSETASFTSYSGSFGPPAQARLAAAAKDAASRGARVVISNHDTPLTRELYAGARIESFPVRRRISRDADNRAPVQELIAVFEP